MIRKSTALYMPLSIATRVASGLLAGAVFSQIWIRLSDGDRPPQTSTSRRWSLVSSACAAACADVTRIGADQGC
jgi:hypothetical protein